MRMEYVIHYKVKTISHRKMEWVHGIIIACEVIEKIEILYDRKVFTSEKELIKQVENMKQDIIIRQRPLLTSKVQTNLQLNTFQCVTYVLITKI